MAQEQQQYSPQDILLDITGRVRSLEGKYNLLRDRVLLINNNMIDEYKKIVTEIKVINEDVKQIKEDIFKIKESMRHLIKDNELFAKKDYLQFLEKYINLWNPMNFVTEEDVIKIIERNKQTKSTKIEEKPKVKKKRVKKNA